MKLIKKFLRSVKSKGGYTLIEVAAVVAITATLGAVVVPIALDKVNAGKAVGARGDVKAIGDAITAFYKDTGNFPAANTTSTNFYQILRSGAEDSTNPIFSPLNHDPVNGVTDSTHGIWTAGGINVDILDNHLTINNPGGVLPPDGTAIIPNNDYFLVHKFTNWKGPYSEPFKKTDPWGHNYLVYVRAMYNPTTGSDKEYGWIISAGPNGRLDTGVKDSKIQGDDIGYALFSAEAEH